MVHTNRRSLTVTSTSTRSRASRPATSPDTERAYALTCAYRDAGSLQATGTNARDVLVASRRRIACHGGMLCPITTLDVEYTVWCLGVRCAVYHDVAYLPSSLPVHGKY